MKDFTILLRVEWTFKLSFTLIMKLCFPLFAGDNKYKKGKLMLNNINAITDNHTDNRINCELNHHGYPIQVFF